MSELKIEYQLPDEVRARLGALVREYGQFLAWRTTRRMRSRRSPAVSEFGPLAPR